MDRLTRELMAGMPADAKVEVVDELLCKDFFAKYGRDKLICTFVHHRSVFVGFYIAELLRDGKPYSTSRFFEEDYRSAPNSFLLDADDVGNDDNALFNDGYVCVVKISF